MRKYGLGMVEVNGVRYATIARYEHEYYEKYMPLHAKWMTENGFVACLLLARPYARTNRESMLKAWVRADDSMQVVKWNN